MLNYDAIFVLAPGLTEEKMDALIAKFEKKIVDNGGEAKKTEKWGMKRLNFEFKRYKGVKDGFYILLPFRGVGKTVSSIKDAFRVQEEVIRHIITRAKEEEAQPKAEEAIVFPDIPEEQPNGQPQ